MLHKNYSENPNVTNVIPGCAECVLEVDKGDNCCGSECFLWQLWAIFAVCSAGDYDTCRRHQQDAQRNTPVSPLTHKSRLYEFQFNKDTQLQ